jgi:hypothetical protein
VRPTKAYETTLGVDEDEDLAQDQISAVREASNCGRAPQHFFSRMPAVNVDPRLAPVPGPFIDTAGTSEMAAAPKKNKVVTSFRIVEMGLTFVCALINGPASAAQADGMLIRHNVSFVVPTAGLAMEESETKAGVFVTRAGRQLPFLELQFRLAIPQRLARRTILQVYCEEAGTYSPPEGPSWTIAKRRRMKN